MNDYDNDGDIIMNEIDKELNSKISNLPLNIMDEIIEVMRRQIFAPRRNAQTESIDSLISSLNTMTTVPQEDKMDVILVAMKKNKQYKLDVIMKDAERELERINVPDIDIDGMINSMESMSITDDVDKLLNTMKTLSLVPDNDKKRFTLNLLKKYKRNRSRRWESTKTAKKETEKDVEDAFEMADRLKVEEEDADDLDAMFDDIDFDIDSDDDIVMY